MLNIFFELDRLRVTLQEKGVDDRIINNVVAKARKEIEQVFEQYGQQAVDAAVELGVQKRSPEFINELRLDALTHEIETDSGRLDFSEPPKPMLPFLLKNAKISKEGYAYKVIPVGKPGDRAKVSMSIIDAQKKIVAERAELAKERQRAIAPAGSKVEYRTASSKQDPTSQWVRPEQEKDFTKEVKSLNEDLTQKLSNAIYEIIQGYVEMY